MSDNPFQKYAPAPTPEVEAPPDPAANPFAKYAPKADEGAPAPLESGGAGLAITRGLINGVPVAGPYILAGANRAAAGIRSLMNDTKFSDELRAVEEVSARTAKERPITTLASELAGGVAGTLPLVAAAPAAFGAGSGGLAARTLASGASGAALGAADSAVRSDGDKGDTAFGAAVGGAVGLASPALGQAVGRGVHALTSRGRSQAVVNEALDGISSGDMDAARALIEHAAGLPGGGVKLSLDEALNAVTNGQANRASQLARVVANSGGEGGRVMGEFYASRPGAVDGVGRAAFDTVAPRPASPTSVGFDLQEAARAGVAQSPEGQALASAQAAAGPRVTPLQMGEAVQPEIRGVQARALQQRDRQAAVDYGRAYDAPERFGVERTVSVERPGEPALVTLDPGAAPAPRFDAPADGGPATIGSLAPQRQPAPPRDPAARSLSRYIAENGGIGLERGDVKAAGLDRWKQPGIGSLVRVKDGKSIDKYWRPRLIEAGYLPPDVDGGAARNIHDELIGLLQQEQRGQKVYPFDWSGSDEKSGFSRLRDQHQDAAGRATADIRAALTDAGIDPRTYDKSVLDRAAAAVMRGDASDPLSAVERAVMAAREPTARPTSKMEPTTVREEIPAPRFLQVDPTPAIENIDRSLVSAKGDIRSALERTRRDAFENKPNPATGETEIDGSVRGIHNWRNRLDQDIAQALEVGDGPKVAALQAQRSAIDEQLKRVPEMATADANFVLNSQPLEPFKGNLPLGRIAAQDPRTGRPTMPPEEVAKVLASPSALREALSVATPDARAAIEGRLKTKILDAAAPKRAGDPVAPDALRKAMLKHEDALAQTPAVRESLERVLSSSEGLARVKASPLGRIAERPDVKAAIETLFPANPLPGSHGEIASTVGTLARNDPQAARDVVRIYMESMFNEATQEVRGVARQYGGAGFASAVRGNSQQRQNLEAAIHALPNGETLWAGLDRMLTTLEATGYRPQKGSDTYFNQVIGERLKEGKGAIGKAITEVASGAAAGAGVAGMTGGLGGAALGAKRAAQEAFRQRRILRDAEAIARILTDPRAETLLRSLARSEPGSRSAEMLSTKLIHLGGRGGASAFEGQRSTSTAP